MKLILRGSIGQLRSLARLVKGFRGVTIEFVTEEVDEVPTPPVIDPPIEDTNVGGDLTELPLQVSTNSSSELTASTTDATTNGSEVVNTDNSQDIAGESVDVQTSEAQEPEKENKSKKQNKSNKK